MSSAFWIGGEEEYSAALAAEHAAKLAGLRAQLESANQPAEREEISAEILAEEAEYRRKVAQMKWLLF